MPLLDTLPDSAVDVIGDVHGEIDALESLLDALGYPPTGRPPAGRTLGVAGALVDRGPARPNAPTSERAPA